MQRVKVGHCIKVYTNGYWLLNIGAIDESKKSVEGRRLRIQDWQDSSDGTSSTKTLQDWKRFMQGTCLEEAVGTTLCRYWKRKSMVSGHEAGQVGPGSTTLENGVMWKPHGQYWAGRTPPPNNGTPNMAAANFVVITNGEGCTINGTAVAAVFIDQ